MATRWLSASQRWGGSSLPPLTKEFRGFRAVGGKGYPLAFAAVAVPVIVLGSWVVLKLYDEPVRRWLKRL